MNKMSYRILLLSIISLCLIGCENNSDEYYITINKYSWRGFPADFPKGFNVTAFIIDDTDILELEKEKEIHILDYQYRNLLQIDTLHWSENNLFQVKKIKLNRKRSYRLHVSCPIIQNEGQKYWYSINPIRNENLNDCFTNNVDTIFLTASEYKMKEYVLESLNSEYYE